MYWITNKYVELVRLVRIILDKPLYIFELLVLVAGCSHSLR